MEVNYGNKVTSRILGKVARKVQEGSDRIWVYGDGKGATQPWSDHSKLRPTEKTKGWPGAARAAEGPRRAGGCGAACGVLWR